MPLLGEGEERDGRNTVKLLAEGKQAVWSEAVGGRSKYSMKKKTVKISESSPQQLVLHTGNTHTQKIRDRGG